MNNPLLRAILIAALLLLLLPTQRPAQTAALSQNYGKKIYIPAVARPLALVTASQMNATLTTTCAVTASGGVKCWGQSNTQLPADPLYPYSTKAVTIPGLSSIKSVSVAEQFACALTNAGGVLCWGLNSSGQLGRGNTTTSLTPAYVTGLSSGVKAITTGWGFACALLNTGAVKCWGNNARGQLGIGAYSSPITTPVDVFGLSSGVTALTSTNRHSCVIQNGGMLCWGSNEYGQIGVNWNPVDDYLIPTAPKDLTSGVVGISVGNNTTCAVLTGGKLKCWGMNSAGQVGNGETYGYDQLVPQDVVGLFSGVKSVTVGHITTCAVLNDSTLKCWGSNSAGQVGNGSTGYGIYEPVIVPGVTGVVEVSPGDDHTCALFSGGVVKCWGDNSYGQLGNGTEVDSLVPVAVQE